MSANRWGRTLCHIALLAALFLLKSCVVESATILMLPALVRSHVLYFGEISVELGSKGHSVHLVLSDDYDVPSKLRDAPGVTLLFYDRTTHGAKKTFDSMNKEVVRVALKNRGDMAAMYGDLTDMLISECETLLLDNEQFFTQLRDIQADISVADAFFMTKCLYLIPFRLGLPIVSIVDTLEPWVLRLPQLPSFIPSEILPYTDAMTFSQRAVNAFVSLVMTVRPPFKSASTAILTKYQQYGELKSINDIISSSLLWLHTTHPVLDYTKPTMTNMVSVGGLTTSPGKSLSPEFQQLVQASDKGVILVSFGTIASHLPMDMAGKMMSAFGSLERYTFLWRFQNLDKLSVPGNVVLKEWLPQNDLLADEKVKLFVTHCGKNGLYESVYHGKPMLGIPILGDQPHNAELMHHKGYGEVIDIYTFTTEELKTKLELLLEDDKYRSRIQAASSAFHDSPELPRQRAARSIEHAIKHGAYYPRSAAYDLAWYQYWLLDVVGAFLAVSFVVLYLSYKLVVCFCRR